MAAAHLTEADADLMLARLFEDSGSSSVGSLFSGGGADTVKVCARVRPMTELEVVKDPRMAVVATGHNTILVSMDTGDQTFTYDRAFGAGADQESIYEQVGRPMVDAVMEGINGAVITYGQTGSGKTYTMEGSDASPDDVGLIPRLLTDLFSRLQAARARYDVRCSCVEVYQERVYDLITYGKGGVEIWEDEARGLTLTGATEVPVLSSGAALRLFREAVANRKTYETEMNAVSSRSHSVLLLTIAQESKDSGVTSFSQLYLADLAGSESVSKSHAEGQRLEEAKYINKSLLALRQVIDKLSSGEKHVPYRDSKLTRLLQNSIGGNSRTALVVTLSPSAWNVQESLSTLRFGSLSSRIQNTAVATRIVTEDKLEQMIAVARERRHRNTVLLTRCKSHIDQFCGALLSLGMAERDLHSLIKGIMPVEVADSLLATARDGADSFAETGITIKASASSSAAAAARKRADPAAAAAASKPASSVLVSSRVPAPASDVTRPATAAPTTPSRPTINDAVSQSSAAQSPSDVTSAPRVRRESTAVRLAMAADGTRRYGDSSESSGEDSPAARVTGARSGARVTIDESSRSAGMASGKKGVGSPATPATVAEGVAVGESARPARRSVSFGRERPPASSSSVLEPSATTSSNVIDFLDRMATHERARNERRQRQQDEAWSPARPPRPTPVPTYLRRAQRLRSGSQPDGDDDAGGGEGEGDVEAGGDDDDTRRDGDDAGTTKLPPLVARRSPASTDGMTMMTTTEAAGTAVSTPLSVHERLMAAGDRRRERQAQAYREAGYVVYERRGPGSEGARSRSGSDSAADEDGEGEGMGVAAPLLSNRSSLVRGRAYA